MSAPYVVSTAPRIGPRVIGKDAYAAELAAMQATGSGLIGKRVLGNKSAAGIKVNPEASKPVHPDSKPLADCTVVEAKSRVLQPGADLPLLWAQEHGRTNGPRKTVVAALREAGYTA